MICSFLYRTNRLTDQLRLRMKVGQRFYLIPTKLGINLIRVLGARAWSQMVYLSFLYPQCDWAHFFNISPFVPYPLKKRLIKCTCLFEVLGMLAVLVAWPSLLLLLLYHDPRICNVGSPAGCQPLRQWGKNSPLRESQIYLVLDQSSPFVLVLLLGFVSGFLPFLISFFPNSFSTKFFGCCNYEIVRFRVLFSVDLDEFVANCSGKKIMRGWRYKNR